MITGVSNLAWPAGEGRAGLRFLADLGVREVELAPFAVFGRWDMSEDEVWRARRSLAERGLACCALQGLLFGAANVHLFASDEARDALHRHLVHVAWLAGALGAGACVFGSPRQRERGTLHPGQAFEIAVAFMGRLAPVFADNGVALAIEGNAARYGCDFLTTTSEAAALVRAVNHPGCRLQLDTGTVFLEGENPATLADLVPLVVHAHVSEPDLAPVGTCGSDHCSIAAVLRNAGYARSMSIEMKPAADWRAGIAASLEAARRLYG